MSIIGSMISLDSRNSIVNERASLIHKQSSGLCRLDLRHIRGRRMLLGQLLVVPSISLIVLTSFTIWKLTGSMLQMHTLHHFRDGIAQQKQRDGAIFALRRELVETVNVLMEPKYSSRLSALYELTDLHLIKTEKRFLKYDVDVIRTTLDNLFVSSFSCIPSSWGDVFASGCYDVIFMYIDVIDELLDTPEEMLIPVLPHEVRSHWLAAISLINAEKQFNMNYILGSVALGSGDLSRRSDVTFIHMIDAVNYHINDIMSFDHHLYHVFNDSLFQSLNFYIHIIADNIETNDSSVSFEWNKICQYFEIEIFQNMKKEIYEGMELEGLQPAFDDLWPIIVLYIGTLIIEIPILMFIIENARTTGISIISSVKMFSSKVAEINKERRRTDLLLKEMLPKSIAKRLLNGDHVNARFYNHVTVYFSDIVDFNEISNTSEPIQIVNFLNDVYSFMDDKLECYDVYKVETIGCVYMVASGLPVENSERHAMEIASMALDLMVSSKSFIVAHLPGYRLQLRVGIHTGPCCAGVVGNKMPRYCLFGDTVNTASRMQTSGEALKIQITSATYMVLFPLNRYTMKHRGDVSVKGKGKMTTYWLLSEKTPETLTPRNRVNMDLPLEAWMAE